MFFCILKCIGAFGGSKGLLLDGDLHIVSIFTSVWMLKTTNSFCGGINYTTIHFKWLKFYLQLILKWFTDLYENQTKISCLLDIAVNCDQLSTFLYWKNSIIVCRLIISSWSISFCTHKPMNSNLKQIWIGIRLSRVPIQPAT